MAGTRSRCVSWGVVLGAAMGVVTLGSPVRGQVVKSASNVTIGLQQVTNVGGRIIDAASKPGDPLIYVARQNSAGQIFAVNPATGMSTQYFTFTGTGVTLADENVSGITFAPGFDTPGSLGYHKLYTYEAEAAPSAANIMFPHPEIASPTLVGVLREWTANASGSFVGATSRVVLNISINATNGVHMGGGMKFGPDGYLYLATGDSGDGGNAAGNAYHLTLNNPTDGQTGRGNPGDANYVPAIGNAQDPTNMLGKVIRIDPLLPASGGKAGETAKVFNGTTAYYVPDDNPFVNNKTNLFFTPTGPANLVTPSAPLPELYALGFRNPWKLSFDANAYLPGSTVDTHPLVSTVGSQTREAIDLVHAGKNYGWPYREGSIASPTAGVAIGRPSPVPYLEASGASYVPFDSDPTFNDPTQMPLPLAEYNTRTVETHSTVGEGSAIAGGFIYRGTRIPQLYGMYIFGDYEFLPDGFTSSGGRLFYLDPNEAAPEKTIYEFNYLAGKGVTANSNGDLMGFAQGSDNELYAMFANGDVKAVMVPEAGTVGMLVLGVMGMMRRRRKKG